MVLENPLIQAGWVALYSFLVAFILPTPSEPIIFAAPALSPHVTIWISALGKTLGSFIAFFFARSILKSNVFEEKILKFLHLKELNDKIEEKTIQIVRKYGYLGLFLCLGLPGAPDTISVYAFSFIESDRNIFLSIVFVASLFRLYLVLWGFNSLFAFFG